MHRHASSILTFSTQDTIHLYLREGTALRMGTHDSYQQRRKWRLKKVKQVASGSRAKSI